MAGAQTTLSLQDKLTGPLMKMMKAMDSTISTMEQMDQTTVNLDQKSLANARRNITNAAADMERLKTSMENSAGSTPKATQAQDKFNESVNRGLPGLISLAAGVLGAVGAFKALSATKSFFQDVIGRGVNFHAFKQSSEVAFKTFLGDAEKAQTYMDNMYAFALKTPFAYPDLLESSRNLIAFGISAENTFPIMQAIGNAVAAVGGSNADMQNMAEIFGVIQAQGKITAMEVNRLAKYGINAYEVLGEAAGVSAGEMKNQISNGAVGAGQAIEGLVGAIDKRFGGLMEGVKDTWVGAIDSMNSARRNIGVALMEDFMVEGGPLITVVQNLTNFFKQIPQYIGPAVAAFLPLVVVFNETFADGRLDAILTNLGTNLYFMANMISILGQHALWVAGVFADNWSWIGPLITTIAIPLGILVGALIAVKMATFLWGIAMGGVNAVMLASPITWIILAIVAVIVLVIQAFIHWGDQVAMVIGFIAGLFAALGAAVYNRVAYMWNHFASFAEFLINLFIDPTYAVKKLIYDMVKMILDNMAAVGGSFDKVADILGQAFVSGANIAITAINWIIKALNLIPGVNIGEMSKISPGAGGVLSNRMKNFANNLEAPTSDKNVVSIKRMENKNISDAFGAGNAFGKSMSNKATDGLTGMADKLKGLTDAPGGAGTNSDISGMMDMPMGMDGSGLSANPTGGKLDKIGKIDDEINIADEDIKLLKDLADRTSIQTFRTLNPTNNFSFGDVTVREDADIDKIVDKLNKKLQQDADSGTDGVYA